jgi:hypothetical protein
MTWASLVNWLLRTVLAFCKAVKSTAAGIWRVVVAMPRPLGRVELPSSWEWAPPAKSLISLYMFIDAASLPESDINMPTRF